MWLVTLAALLLGPWIETLLMWPILAILKKVVQNTILVAVASAVVWGIFHGLTDPGWGLIVLWPFFVFSLCFLAWEQKSRKKAIVVTSLVHMCHNSVPVVSILAARWL
jgi:ABC-type nickel/cobalt efflux system permease component RcnA